MKLKNLTPHAVTIQTPQGFVEIPAFGGEVPRLAVNRQDLGALSTEYGSIPLVRSALGKPAGLPEPEEGCLLIVSALVAEHPDLNEREDLVYPGEPLRDGQGQIVGCKGLCAGPGLARKLTN